MFGDVARFAEADYFAAHPAGSISLPDAAYTIELFACVVTDAYDTAIYTPERYHDDVGGAAGLCGGAGRAAAGHRCDGAGPAGGAFDLRRGARQTGGSSRWGGSAP